MKRQRKSLTPYSLNVTSLFCNEKCGIIDTPNDVVGWPVLNSLPAPIDSDNDGMADEWETTCGLNPDVNDNNKLNADGYTALEVYLNSLAGEKMSSDFTYSSIKNISISPAAQFNSSTRLLIVDECMIGAKVEVFSLDSRRIASKRINSKYTFFDELPHGVFVMRIRPKFSFPVTLKILNRD